jgi:DNA-binding response OmpR family regulator
MKVIMVTARDSGDEVLEALQSGADDFLMKPVDREMLTEKMRMVGLQP